MSLAARPRRLVLPIWVLSLTCACIWPQPVNEEPPQNQNDETPSFNYPTNPSVVIVSQHIDQNCVATIQSVLVNSPLGLPLTARLYINFPTSQNLPIHVAGQIDVALQPFQNQTLLWQLGPGVGVDLSSPEVKSQLVANQPNILWLWVSDGFGDPTDPTAATGRSSISTSWWIDFTNCSPFNTP